MSTLREAPHDPVLPHLALALDEAQMAAHFQRHFGAAGARLEVRACRIERVKYRPGRNCVLAYRLMVQAPGGAIGEQRLCAGLYPEADARERFERARSERRDAVDGLPAATLIGALNMLVRCFPNDRKLPALARLTDAAAMREQFVAPLAQARFGAHTRVAHSQQCVVSYFPEHACTIAVDATLDAAAGEAAMRSGASANAALLARPSGDAVMADRAARDLTWRIYGKTRYDDAGADTLAVMQALWHSSAHRDGALGYARPLAYDAGMRLLWQEGVADPTLSRLLDSGIDAHTCARVGAAVAALHDTPLDCARRLSAADWRGGLVEAAEVLARSMPEQAAAIGALQAELAGRAPAGEVSTDATVHGDLHANNVLVGAQRITLIDLDRVMHGYGLAELCEVLAELVGRACMRGEAFDPALPRAMLGAYAHARGTLVDEETSAWYVAAALLRDRARRCVTSLKPGRAQAVPRLLAAAREILAAPAQLRRAA